MKILTSLILAALLAMFGAAGHQANSTTKDSEDIEYSYADEADEKAPRERLTDLLHCHFEYGGDSQQQCPHIP